MKNFNKLYKRLKKEQSLDEFIELLQRGLKPIITVHTALISDWDNHTTLTYDIEKDMYVLVINSKHDARKIKRIMNDVKKDIIRRTAFEYNYTPIINFDVRHYMKKMIRTRKVQ